MFRPTRRQVLRYGAGLALAPSLGALDANVLRGAEPAAKPKIDPYADAVLIPGEPPALTEGSFTVAVLPDTQHYSEKYPEQFHAQTEWIVANRQRRNIACVLHLGDVTNHNTAPEWEVAASAMSKLDGAVPYFMTLGNHDYGEQGKCDQRSTQFQQYFPADKLRAQRGFGGIYDRAAERLDNSYYLFSAGGRDFLVLSLEFGPRGDVIRWANEVAARHRDRQAILITHAYMYYDETRYDWVQRGKDQKWNPHSYPLAAHSTDINDGEELWQKLVGKQENFILTLNGHVLNDGLGRTVTPTAAGRNVHQCLVNFQMKPNGGDGWLRLLEFRPDGTTVEVYDYSPTRGERNESSQNRFTMNIAALKKTV
ncbi:MAG: metallophosphoesterase [Planctomycetes bacterium]|nr:metallophosphoesterase [Planctomycetota bacterium]